MLRRGPHAQQHPTTMGSQSAPGPLPVVLVPSFSSPRHLCPPDSSAREVWLQTRGLLSHRHGEGTGGKRGGVGKGHTQCPDNTQQPCSTSHRAGARGPHIVTGSPTAKCCSPSPHRRGPGRGWASGCSPSPPGVMSLERLPQMPQHPKLSGGAGSLLPAKPTTQS